MPAVPLPDQGTKDLLDQAYAQARSELKGQAPDSLLQPFTPGAIPSPGTASLTVSTPPPAAEPVSDPSAPPAGAVPYGSDVESTPPPDAEAVTKKPSTFQGFWSELGNQTMKSLAEAGKGIANLGWGAFIRAASALPGDHSKDAEAADAGFKAIEDTFSPAIQHWQGNVDANAATTGKGAKIAAGVLGGAAPLALGPEAFLGQATMNAGTESIDANQDLKTAYTLAGINLMANAAGMKVPFKSPNVVKRVLANGAYGATVSAASEWLTKKFLNDGGYKEAADNIDPTDPTTLATSGLISAIFGYLEKPAIRKGFEERGGKLPDQAPPPGAQPVAAVSPETPAPATPAPPPEAGTAGAGVIPDKPTAEPVSDLQAQIADMKDPKTARKAVYLAPDNVKELGTDGVAELATGAKQIRNFDGKGGVLIVPDVETAKVARDLKKTEPDMQKVLGQLTGAGDGKAPDDTVVVQGQTPEGAVASEGVVRPDEVPNKVAEVQAEGKTPVVTTPEAAIERRSEALAQTPPKGAEIVESVSDSAVSSPKPAEEAPQAEAAPKAASEERPKAVEQSTPEEPTPAEKSAPKSALEQTMADLVEKEKPAKGRKLVPLKDRMENTASAGAALKAAAKEAHSKGVDEKLVDRANSAANEAIRLASKTEEQTAKGQGTGHPRVTAIVDEMHKAARLLEGRGQPGDEVKVETRAATLKARVEKQKAAAGFVSATAEEIAAHTRQARKPLSVRLKEEAEARAGKNRATSEQVATKEPKPATEDNTITVKPHIIRGRELEALVKETGVDPADIAAAAEKATGKKRGALTGYLQELANGMDVNKGWLPHMSALNPERSKSSPLTRSQHIQLKNLIKRFAISDAKNAEHARDALTNFMNDLNGKRLDERTQAAVHEYAQARRRMEVLKDQAGEDEDVSPGEAVHDEGHEDEESSERQGSEADSLWGDRYHELRQDDFARLVNSSHVSGESTGLHDALRAAMHRDDLGPAARGLIASVLKHVRDVPVKFVSKIDSGNRLSSPSGAFFYNRNILKPGRIEVRVNSPEGSPLQTLVHESVHAATSHFITQFPDHPLVKELDELRRVSVDRSARAMMEESGRPWQGLQLDREWYERQWAGDKYGLTNTQEFAAEALSNPNFMRMLAEHERFASPFDKVKNIIAKFADVIRRMLGLEVSSPEAKLLNRVLGVTGSIMKEQRDFIRALEHPPETPFSNELVSFRDGEEAEKLRALDDEPPRIINEDKIMEHVPEALRGTLRSLNHVTKSGAFDAMRKNFAGLSSFDQLVRRRARFFGKSDDPANPLRQYAEVRSERDVAQNKLVDRISPVAENWLRLTPAQDRRVSQFMIDSTIWGIDPTVAKDAHSAKTQAQRGYDARYDEYKARWKNLSPAEQKVYTDARDANKWLVKQSRKAAVDSVMRAVDDLITPAERQQLYDVKDPREYDQLIGPDKLIDLSDQNDTVRDALKDLAGLHEMDGPYFHLGRDGSKVVQVTPEGTKEFATKEEALRFADQVRDLGPASTAKIAERGGKHVVDYTAKYVSMHSSEAEAEADAARMRAAGFDVGPVTEKTLSKDNAPLTHGMRELVAEAQRKIESHGADETTQAMTDSLRSAFVQLIAARSAYAGSKLARKGVAGVKPDEMRMNFARHAQATAWHTANLGSVFKEAETLAKLREAARNPEIGNADQKTMYARGRVVHELGRRVQQEVQDYGVKRPFNSALAKLGFMNYLFSPAHTLIWLTQNFTTGLPVAGARYGYGRATGAFMKGMGSPAIPALRATMKGLFSKPGSVTNTDVTRAIVEAIRKDPALGKWAQGENSHIQQLMDRGAINSTLSNELSSLAKGENSTVAKVFEWSRLMPHMADAYNRISTALAGLELTNGDVTKTADLVREIHVDYSFGNKPRMFKTLNRIPGGNSIGMFKTYMQGMAHLLYSNMYDAITGEGKSKAEAAKTVAGMVIATSIFAGAIKGAVLEPVRLAAYAYNKLFGDDGEYYSLDNSIRRFLSETLGERAGHLVAGGVPRELGFDLSSRMGLSDLFFHDPPDLLGTSKDKFMQFVGSQLGPMPELAADVQDQFSKHWARGELGQAVLSAVPIKALHDAQKAYTFMTEGRRTAGGGQVLGADKFNGYDAALQTFGLKPSKIADVQEKQSTAYDYHNWAAGRKQSLIAAYTSAAPGDRGDIQKQIDQWNSKNPGVRVTYSDLRRQAVSNQRAAQLGRGQPGRDPVVNKLLNY